jgi:hypothetical protein
MEHEHDRALTVLDPGQIDEITVLQIQPFPPQGYLWTSAKKFRPQGLEVGVAQPGWRGKRQGLKSRWSLNVVSGFHPSVLLSFFPIADLWLSWY